MELRNAGISVRERVFADQSKPDTGGFSDKTIDPNEQHLKEYLGKSVRRFQSYAARQSFLQGSPVPPLESEYANVCSNSSRFTLLGV
jgi:hypothetical protein